MRRTLAVCALLVGFTASAEARDLTAADLGWPETTRSVKTRVATKVYKKRAKRQFGKIARGQHLAWKRIVKSHDRCKTWIEIEPRGWICGKDVRPSDDEPVAVAVPRTVLTGTEFTGLDLVASPPPSWPFAWALEPQPFVRDEKKPRDPRPTPVLAAADADAAVVRTLEPRTVVPILELDGEFARIGEGEWVARTELRIASKAVRPDGVADDARWIDVDLDEQVMISYQGDAAVHATLVSSGRRNGTPTGIYRIASKTASKTMDDGGKSAGRWKHRNVAFVMHFRKRYAIHSAYWHDRFGNQRSVGCVNLAPEDARFLYSWASPDIPEGWLEVQADGDEGSVVRIHSRRDPDPAWVDYDGEPLANR
jgi:lipoprotein-anchoring transpeptidase ErfK/SrfK